MDETQKWTLITAIVGAAAWIPPVFSLVKDWVTKPRLTVETSSQCEVGFTELGPILNIKMAITVDKWDVFIDCIEFDLIHESGARHKFRWHEVVEVKGQVIIPGAPSQPVMQESEAIALKILPTDFKYFQLRTRMQSHTEGFKKYDQDLVRERRRLVNNNQYDPYVFYASKSVQDMQAFMQSQMAWKKGIYRMCVQVHAHSKIEVAVSDVEFSITDDDIVLLHTNCDNIPKLLKNSCLAGTVNANQIQPIEWQWLNKQLKKT